MHLIFYLLLIIAAILLSVLFSPITIEINSITGFYGASGVFRTISVWIGFDQTVKLYIKWFRWVWEIQLLSVVANASSSNKKPSVKRVDKKAQTSKQQKVSFKVVWRKVKGVLHEVRVRQFIVRLNTGDAALNGHLYPYAYALAAVLEKDISVAFWGENIVMIEMETTPMAVLVGYLKS